MTENGEGNDVVEILKQGSKMTERWANSWALQGRQKHIFKLEVGSLNPILATEKLVIPATLQMLIVLRLKNDNKHQYEGDPMWLEEIKIIG